MYTTIEAEIQNGTVTGAEIGKLPLKAHVLITVLDPPERKPNWENIWTQLGKLSLRGDSAKWQQEIRSEWE